MFAVGQDPAGECDLVERADRLADGFLFWLRPELSLINRFAFAATRFRYRWTILSPETPVIRLAVASRAASIFSRTISSASRRAHQFHHAQRDDAICLGGEPPWTRYSKERSPPLSARRCRSNLEILPLVPDVLFLCKLLNRQKFGAANRLRRLPIQDDIPRTKLPGL
jgi:hypothetical protein